MSDVVSIGKQLSQKNNGWFKEFLSNQCRKSILRFMTCGGVDDGKSTLIGRLLHDTKHIYIDQLFSLINDSKRLGTQGEDLDLALLVDGLQDERAQGITIDVAYRYFSTKNRNFIMADTPGHEQYIRNMVTGASTSNVAVLLIDARKGICDQTRRHSFISALLGIKYFIVAVNKMDLVNYDEFVFKSIESEYLSCIKDNLPYNVCVKFIPISALKGDNIVKQSVFMSWYKGHTLLNILENLLIVHDDKLSGTLRFPIQYVNRCNLDFRGYSGSVESGRLYVNQLIKVLPSCITTSISRIVTFDGDKTDATSGEVITLILKDDIDISRGDILVDVNESSTFVQRAQIDVVWMGKTPLRSGYVFNVKVACRKVRASVLKILYQVDINTLHREKISSLSLNAIGLVEIYFYEPVFLDNYINNTTTGGIIFIDLISNLTVGVGMVKSVVVDSCDNIRNYNAFELELNALIRYHFPHWNVRDLLLDVGDD